MINCCKYCYMFCGFFCEEVPQSIPCDLIARVKMSLMTCLDLSRPFVSFTLNHVDMYNVHCIPSSQSCTCLSIIIATWFDSLFQSSLGYFLMTIVPMFVTREHRLRHQLLLRLYPVESHLQNITFTYQRWMSSSDVHRFPRWRRNFTLRRIAPLMLSQSSRLSFVWHHRCSRSPGGQLGVSRGSAGGQMGVIGAWRRVLCPF